jgi:hypothetical protein
MKKRFTIGGAIVGLLSGGGFMIYAWIRGLTSPGILELVLQAVTVGVFVLAGALAGLLVGWLVSLCVRKK